MVKCTVFLTLLGGRQARALSSSVGRRTRVGALDHSRVTLEAFNEPAARATPAQPRPRMRTPARRAPTPVIGRGRCGRCPPCTRATGAPAWPLQPQPLQPQPLQPQPLQPPPQQQQQPEPPLPPPGRPPPRRLQPPPSRPPSSPPPPPPSPSPPPLPPPRRPAPHRAPPHCVPRAPCAVRHSFARHWDPRCPWLGLGKGKG